MRHVIALMCLACTGLHAQDPLPSDEGALTARAQAMIARQAFLAKLVGELDNEARLLEIRQRTADARVTELRAALARAQQAHGVRRLRDAQAQIGYDNSAEIQRISKALAASESDARKIVKRLGVIKFERAKHEPEVQSIEAGLRECRIALEALGADVAKIFAGPEAPKVERATGPQPAKIFVTKAGTLISAVAAERQGEVWMITTPQGKTIAVEVAEVERIIDRTQPREKIMR